MGNNSTKVFSFDIAEFDIKRYSGTPGVETVVENGPLHSMETGVVKGTFFASADILSNKVIAQVSLQF